MSVNKYNSATGSLERIAGGTLFADLPLLSWIKYDNQTNLPEGFLKAGDSISEADCPEAYAEYGATVPYKADTSELSNFESVVLPMTAPYDGFITASGYDGAYLNFSVNGTNVYIRSAATGVNAATATVPIHKGDTVAFASADGSYYVKARYYKKSLVLKAKQVALPADFAASMREYVDSQIVDSVADGSMKAVTSNAVYDALGNKWGYTVLPQDTDLNTVVANGSYNVSFSMDYAAVHFPVADWGVLVVTVSVSNVQQVFHSVGINNAIYVRNKVNNTWGTWEKLITQASFNDWERVTITMESGYTNALGAPDVYWSPSRKQLYISKLDAIPPSDWVNGTPFCRFTRPSGFNYNVWGLGFFANIYWPSGAFYPISCAIWANPNDGNDLGLVLNSIDIAPGEHSISNLSVRILGVVLQGM